MKKSLTIAFLIVISFITNGCGLSEPDKHEIWMLGQSVYTPDLLLSGLWTSSDRTIGAMFESGSHLDNYGTNEYFVFPIPSSQKRIQSAEFLIVTRTGLQEGDVVMNLEIYDLHGNLQHTVSSSPINMQTTPTGMWTTVSLSAASGDLVISPGEYLAFHWSRSGEPDPSGEELQVGTLFEVEVIEHE